MKTYMKKITVTVVLVTILLVLSASMVAAAGGTYHTVRQGQTLFGIGRQYGVSPYYIAQVNNLTNPDCIYADQVLYIPAEVSRPSYPNKNYDYGCNYYCGDNNGGYNRTSHTVAYGETLSSIGYKYGVSAWAIASANGLYNIDCIYAGQTLYIPMAGYQQPYWQN